jgi:hypothetical protein
VRMCINISFMYVPNAWGDYFSFGILFGIQVGRLFLFIHVPFPL